MSCGIGHRCSSGLVLLWLWCRPAAIAPIRPPAWELSYALRTALGQIKKKRKKEKKSKKKENKQKKLSEVLAVAQRVKNQISIHEDVSLIPGFSQ